MAFLPRSGAELCAALPCVWHRQRTTPLWHVTMFKLVGSDTITASGAFGSSEECPVCQLSLNCRAPSNPCSSFTVKATTQIGLPSGWGCLEVSQRGEEAGEAAFDIASAASRDVFADHGRVEGGASHPVDGNRILMGFQHDGGPVIATAFQPGHEILTGGCPIVGRNGDAPLGRDCPFGKPLVKKVRNPILKMDFGIERLAHRVHTGQRYEFAEQFGGLGSEIRRHAWIVIFAARLPSRREGPPGRRRGLGATIISRERVRDFFASDFVIIFTSPGNILRHR